MSERILERRACSEARVAGLELAHGLADREVIEDFFGASQDGAKFDIVGGALDDGAHARLGDGAPAKDLGSGARDGLHRAGAARLAQRDRAAERDELLLERHRAHLVAELLDPRVARLHLGRHAGEPRADHRLGDERLAESLADRGPAHALLQEQTGLSHDASAHNPPLVVKVDDDALEALVLLADEIFDRDASLVKGDEGCPRGFAVARRHALGRDLVAALDEEEAHAAGAGPAGADGGGEVVGAGAAGDPLFGPRHFVEATARRLGRNRGDARGVRAGVCVRDGEADAFLAREHLWQNLRLHGRRSEVYDWRETDGEPTPEAIVETGRAELRELFHHHDFVEVVEDFAVDASREREPVEVATRAEPAGEDARLPHREEQILVRLFALLVIGDRHGRNLLLDESAQAFAERFVRLVVVR
mmetsp:Transcript_9080/g.29846  ORF Transcript_9080/g.29846 Transcript_9080/m.29846 type:complete len:420 (-) Transcript_9080:74-1333(-)